MCQFVVRIGLSVGVLGFYTKFCSKILLWCVQHLIYHYLNIARSDLYSIASYGDGCCLQRANLSPPILINRLVGTLTNKCDYQNHIGREKFSANLEESLISLLPQSSLVQGIIAKPNSLKLYECCASDWNDLYRYLQ